MSTARDRSHVGTVVVAPRSPFARQGLSLQFGACCLQGVVSGHQSPAGDPVPNARRRRRSRASCACRPSPPSPPGWPSVVTPSPVAARPRSDPSQSSPQAPRWGDWRSGDGLHDWRRSSYSLWPANSSATSCSLLREMWASPWGIATRAPWPSPSSRMTPASRRACSRPTLWPPCSVPCGCTAARPGQPLWPGVSPTRFRSCSRPARAPTAPGPSSAQCVSSCRASFGHQPSAGHHRLPPSRSGHVPQAGPP